MRLRGRWEIGCGLLACFYCPSRPVLYFILSHDDDDDDGDGTMLSLSLP